MVIFGYGKEVIRELQADIKELRSDIERVQDQLKSFKGYVYAKKIKVPEPEQEQEQDFEESSKHLNIGFPLKPI